MNGGGLKIALMLIGILVSINIAITSWALTNIVEIREALAVEKGRLTAIESTRFRDSDGLQLRADMVYEINTHTH